MKESDSGKLVYRVFILTPEIINTKWGVLILDKCRLHIISKLLLLKRKTKMYFGTIGALGVFVVILAIVVVNLEHVNVPPKQNMVELTIV